LKREGGSAGTEDTSGACDHVRLKIFMTKEVCARGCCGGTHVCSGSESLFPGEREASNGVSDLLSAVKKLYCDRVRVSIVNPWSLLAMWDSIRFRVNPATPAWILGGRKIFEGLPKIEQLKAALDAELAKCGQKVSKGALER
jgi:hypothetical protein